MADSSTTEPIDWNKMTPQSFENAVMVTADGSCYRLVKGQWEKIAPARKEA